MQRRSSEPPALAGYQYVRLLGSGGFSDVFLYDQAFPKRRVAVKVLLLDDLTEDSRTAFAAEANVMAQLSAHPYIVTIFQAAVADDDRPYLVMEYCSGPSLAEQYKREPLAVAQTLEMGVRLASAIATAHAAGILHRDVKPANVLTNQFGWPALTDFGIASTVDELAPTMTTTSRSLGGPSTTGGGTASIGMSIPWSPPEMFDDLPQPDVRSDVFSLAATLYTVLAGHTPFEVPGRSNGSVDLIGRIARGAVTPMPRTDVPASLNAVLHKGMASDRTDRYATAVEFGRALQRIEVELAYPQTPLDVPNLAIERPERAPQGEDSSADETRARVIPTVRAQATPLTVPPPSVIVPPVPIHPVPTETVVRRPTPHTEGAESRGSSSIDPATVLRMPREPEATVAEGAKPRRRRFALFSAAAVILIAAIIVVSVLVARGAGLPTSASSQGAVGQNAGPPAGEDAGVPAPSHLVGVLSADDGTVKFTWADPKPHKGDSYAWAPVVNQTPGQTTTVSSPTASVAYVTGKQSCIEVWIVRDSQPSAKAATGCYPQ